MALQKDITVKGITLNYWKLNWEKTGAGFRAELRGYKDKATRDLDANNYLDVKYLTVGLDSLPKTEWVEVEIYDAIKVSAPVISIVTPAVPAIPAVPAVLAIPAVPAIPAVMDGEVEVTPEVPEVPEVPGVPEVPEVPAVPAVTSTVETNIWYTAVDC